MRRSTSWIGSMIDLCVATRRFMRPLVDELITLYAIRLWTKIFCNGCLRTASWTPIRRIPRIVSHNSTELLNFIIAPLALMCFVCFSWMLKSRIVQQLQRFTKQTSTAEIFIFSVCSLPLHNFIFIIFQLSSSLLSCSDMQFYAFTYELLSFASQLSLLT